MNSMKIVSMLILMLLLTMGCSDRDNPLAEENKHNDVISSHKLAAMNESDGDYEIMDCPFRDDYDIVIVDADNWEILLKPKIEKFYALSYEGILWYQMGVFSCTGTATAMWDINNETLTITAFDSNKEEEGYVTYTLSFEAANSTAMTGGYFYYEYPVRFNGIRAQLVKGRIAGHDAGR